MKPVAVTDYRNAARARLPKFLFEYIDGGSYSEATLRRNESDLQDIILRQRVLRDVSAIDLTTTLHRQTLAMPVILGPIGLAGMNARRGEVQAVRAADAAGIPFTLSTVSACSINEVANAAQKPFWFQLYMVRDRAFMSSLLEEARNSGCETLVFTVDMPLPGSRYRDYRSGLAGAPGFMGAARRIAQGVARPHWAWEVGIHGRPHSLGNVAPLLGAKTGLEDFFAWIRENFDPAATWADLAWVRANWDGPLLLKGILDVEDARRALDTGADGLIVSNHGGRQLDGALSTARALPAIAKAVGKQLPILVDGGIRSGLDVVRMLALGANAVLLGRLWAYALAAGGEAAVGNMLKLLRNEIHVAMALTGATRISEIGDHIICKPEAS